MPSLYFLSKQSYLFAFIGQLFLHKTLDRNTLIERIKFHRALILFTIRTKILAIDQIREVCLSNALKY